jgi:hypothetical protein
MVVGSIIHVMYFHTHDHVNATSRDFQVWGYALNVGEEEGSPILPEPWTAYMFGYLLLR